MRRWCLRILAVVVAVIATAVFAPAVVPSTAHAVPGILVYPGMEIRQEKNVCTLGFVDVQTRTAFTAGHCRGSGSVGDRDGNVIGHQTLFRDNTPDGATVATDHLIADWEAIQLAPDVALNNVLPGGRLLVVDFAAHAEEYLREQFAHRRLGFSQDEVAAFLAEAGLVEVETRLVAPATGESGKLTVAIWLARDPRVIADDTRSVSREFA